MTAPGTPRTDSESWRRIEELCQAALDRPPHERGAFLAAACAGDDVLRHEVEALLAHAQTADAFLGASLGAVAAHVMGGGTGQSLIGRTFGPYHVLAAIGAGGMGEVYRARDSKLGRDVAIKVLPAAFTADRDRLARFEREARVLASLNHPNIAAIYGLEQIGDVQALVLELVEGETLAERIGVRGSGLGVGDAFLVRRFERLGDLPRDRQRLVEWNRPARDAVSERLALDEFEYERVRLTAVLEPINRTNVRMIERGQHLRLALETCEAVGVERERVGDDLQRDVAIQLGIAGAIDLAHAAGAELADDFVRADTRA
jgi:hypothetical protein